MNVMQAKLEKSFPSTVQVVDEYLGKFKIGKRGERIPCVVIGCVVTPSKERFLFSFENGTIGYGTLKNGSIYMEHVYSDTTHVGINLRLVEKAIAFWKHLL